MLLEVALPFAVACGTLGLAWLHSIFRWQNRASRGAWVVLTAACFATAVVNVRAAPQPRPEILLGTAEPSQRGSVVNQRADLFC